MDITTKLIPITESKVVEEDGKVYLTGYANTKGNEDSHGDIPANYEGKPVYRLERMKTNPVCLVDHRNSSASIAGNFVELSEDEKGLWFKLLFRSLDDIYNPTTKDAVSAYMKGFGRALSIGGRWYYEDENNRNNLTKAVIFEISLVAIGSDGNALTNADYPKHLKQKVDPIDLEGLSKMDERTLEEALKSGISFSGKASRALISAIKSSGLRDEEPKGHRDGAEDWSEVLQGLTSIKIS